MKRAYEPPASNDGIRYLVDGLWPRGVKKEALRIEAWLRDVAPSTELRHWYGHERKRWDAFRRRYARELDRHLQAWEPILAAARRGPVTLVYSARETERNNAVALREYLESHAGKKRAATQS